MCIGDRSQMQNLNLARWANSVWCLDQISIGTAKKIQLIQLTHTMRQSLIVDQIARHAGGITVFSSIHISIIASHIPTAGFK